MPLPGTRDPTFILDAVAKSRGSVLVSCVVQLLSAAAWAAALVLLPAPSRTRAPVAWWVGTSLLAVGMTGNSADAIFHLAAYELARSDVDHGVALLVMQRLQGPDLALLLPSVGAFVLGLVAFALAGAQVGLLPRRALGFFVLAAVSVVARRLLPGDLARRIAGVFVLACGVAPVGWIGWTLASRASPPLEAG